MRWLFLGWDNDLMSLFGEEGGAGRWCWHQGL